MRNGLVLSALLLLPLLAFVFLLNRSISSKGRRADVSAAIAPPEAENPEPPPPQKLSCPVKLVSPRMVHNLEMDVYVTVVNISDTDITAIAFGSAHTDKFGVTRTPYKTDLTSEDTIRRKHSQSMHWQVLMEEVAGGGGNKPGSSQLYVTKVAFADGRVVDLLGIERPCGIDF